VEKRIKTFLSKCGGNNKKRFDLNALENYVVDSYKGHNLYLKNGGYFKLYDEIMLLKLYLSTQNFNMRPGYLERPIGIY